MNVETTLQVFLPYHDSPNFARILAILTIPQTSPFYAGFHPLIKNAQPVPRAYIATAISPAKEPSLRLLSGVIGSVRQAMKEGTVHRALLAFWTSTIVEMLERTAGGQAPSEGMVKLLVEAFVEIMTSNAGGQDVNVSRLPSANPVLSTDDSSGRRLPAAPPPNPLRPSRRRSLRRTPLGSDQPRLRCKQLAADPHSACPP